MRILTHTISVLFLGGSLLMAQSPVGDAAPRPNEQPADQEWAGAHFRDVAYKQVGGRELRMDIYRPTGRISSAAPVIYYVHGGGWAVGSKEKFTNRLMLPVFKQLAENGFVCVAISYRLSRKGQGVLMRDCVTDAMDGLRFLKKHADTYGIDPDRMVVFGDSAGGQIVQMLAVKGPEGFPGDPTLAAFGVRPRAVISWYGPTDFTDVTLFQTDLENKKPDRFGERITGDAKGFDRFPEAYAEMSSHRWLEPDSPPMLLIHGDTDATIPYVHATHLKTKADRIGADVTLVTVEHAGHNWRKAGGDPKPDVHQIQQITVDYALRQVQAAPRKSQPHPHP